MACSFKFDQPEAIREWKNHRDLLSYTMEELRYLVREGDSSGPSSRAGMADVKAEAKRRLEAEGRQS